MTASQSLTGGKLLFLRQTFRLSPDPNPFSAFNAFMALRAKWRRFRAE